MRAITIVALLAEGVVIFMLMGGGVAGGVLAVLGMALTAGIVHVVDPRRSKWKTPANGKGRSR